MALYAFDGTCNEYHGESASENTNVVRFVECHQGTGPASATIALMSDDEEYIKGVGTRLGKIGLVLGGFNGAGGRQRVRDLRRRFRENWSNGDHVVDVIGFSRGAALALHFSNALSDGVEIDGQTVIPEIRFLGLWDTVPSFGLPGVLIGAFNSINVGWRLSVPRNVRKCFHAMALDEDRQAFRVHRPKVKDPGMALEELWFRGVHSDVGGGAESQGLSSIALLWMLKRAHECGLSIDPSCMDAVAAACRPLDPPTRNKFGGEREWRKPRCGDRFHKTAALPLPVGATQLVEVNSRLKFNTSTVLVESGARYVFEFDPKATWVDKNITCTAAGWPDKLPDNKPGWLDDIKWAVLNSYIFSHVRRVRDANWFELVACLDYDVDAATPIGSGQHAKTSKPWSPTRTGRLSLFANDAESKYEGNCGTLNVTVQRVG